MANRYANLVGSNKISDEWQKINDGFDAVEQEMDKKADQDSLDALEGVVSGVSDDLGTEVSAREELEQRVDNIINEPSPGKDAELVDIRTPAAEYTPLDVIDTAGGMTRDMQKQFVAHKAETMQDENITVNIPSDYATMQSAVNELSKRSIKPGVVITLNIESGHKISERLSMTGGSYSHFRIVSEDEVVELDDSFYDGDLFIFRNCLAPTLATIFDMGGKGRNGYTLRNAKGKIESGCGVMNAVRDCVLVDNGGSGEMNGMIASGAGRYNLHCAVSALVAARSSTFADAAEENIYVSHTSAVTADGSVITGAGGFGAICNGASNLDLANATIEDCVLGGIRADNTASIRAINSTISNNVGRDLQVRNGGSISATGCTTTNGSPSIADTNINAFNQVYSEGIIYDENATNKGTFIPTIAGGTTAGNHEYSVQLGRYERHGDVVTFSLRITISNFDNSAAGTLTIKGFPFSAQISGSVPFPVYIESPDGVPSGWQGSWFVRMVSSGDLQLLYYNNAGNRTAANIEDVVRNSTSISVTGTIEVS